MRETKSIKNFYIYNLIKVVLYYGLSIFILLLLDNGIKSDIDQVLLNNKIENQKLKDFLYSIVDKLVNMIGGVLATFNTFLEKVAFGTRYIFLLSEPKCFERKKMIYFRLLALISSVICYCLFDIKRFIQCMSFRNKCFCFTCIIRFKNNYFYVFHYYNFNN